MNRILLFLIIFFAFAKCQLESETIDNQNITPQKGLVINQSSSLKNGEYKLIATNNSHEKIITIEGDSIEVDFNDLTLIGTNDLTKPDAFQGVAIHIKKGKNITIKNLNVIGYRMALQVDSVENLTIDSCNFSFNYRADSMADFDINKVKEGAVTINYSNRIIIQNSTISNNYNGIVLNQSKRVNIDKSTIQFHPKVGIMINDKSRLRGIDSSFVDWNLTATTWDSSGNGYPYYSHNSLTHNGFTFVSIKDQLTNTYTATQIDFRHPKFLINKNVQLDPKYPKGEIYKIPTKYGVYNFEYPAIFLREKSDNQYTFAMFGPTVGNWKFVNAKNVKSTNLKSGAFPATFVIQQENPNEPFSIEFEFIGATFQDEFGVWNKKGKVFEFGYHSK